MLRNWFISTSSKQNKLLVVRTLSGVNFCSLSCVTRNASYKSATLWISCSLCKHNKNCVFVPTFVSFVSKLFSELKTEVINAKNGGKYGNMHCFFIQTNWIRVIATFDNNLCAQFPAGDLVHISTKFIDEVTMRDKIV